MRPTFVQNFGHLVACFGIENPIFIFFFFFSSVESTKFVSEKISSHRKCLGARFRPFRVFFFFIFF